MKKENQEKNAEISARIRSIIDDIGVSPNAFALKLNYKRGQTVYDILNGKSAPSYDFFNRFMLSEYSEIYSMDWLLTGKGDMMKTKRANNNICFSQAPVLDCKDTNIIQYTQADAHEKDAIPLIPAKAMAGFFTGEVIINRSDCELIRVPGVKADFAIPVSGDSMTPLYHSGDLVICQFVNLSDMFFQWGKVYVINTNQGVLIKKVRPGSSKNTITLISENSDYDSISLPLSDIYQIALVKGLVRII